MKITKIATLKAFKNGRCTTLIQMAITKAYTLEQFQNTRCRYIENTKHYYDRYETTLV